MNVYKNQEVSTRQSLRHFDDGHETDQYLAGGEVIGQQRQLRDFVNQLRGWLYEVEQMGIPKFGETGYRLRSLRQSLQEHFDCCRRRRGEGLSTEFEVESHSILQRLDNLIERLELPDPPFESWQQLIRSLNDFSNDLESLEARFVSCDCR